MDYILEELERQRLAMELLLAAPARETAAGAEEDRGEESRGRAGRQPGDVRREDVRVMEAGVPAVKETGESSAVWDGGRKTRGGETMLRLSAQEVSRAVERDARRYDGGDRAY